MKENRSSAQETDPAFHEPRTNGRAEAHDRLERGFQSVSLTMSCGDLMREHIKHKIAHRHGEAL